MSDDSNTLRFKISIDSQGLKKFESESQSAFSGVKRSVQQLTGYTTEELKRMSAAMKATTAQWEDYRRQLGLTSKEMRAFSSYVRDAERSRNSFVAGFGNAFGGGGRSFFTNIAGAFGGGQGLGAIATGLDAAKAAGGGFMAMLGGLAGGAFIGGVIAVTRALQSVAASIYEVGKASIEAASSYEITRNAFKAFTGSASDAEKELAQLHETAKNTPGLSMEDAEKGARNLRALGFSADTARGLIAGLAKQKLMSGADEAAVQRVVVNLTQLSAGSSRASQDLREIFHALPTMRKEFFQAFGTLDPGKIASEFSEHSESALAKLSAQMEKTKGIQGGLTDATIKFWDAWERAKRDLGDASLPVLTEFLKGFTGELDKNENKFKEWGRGLAAGIDFFLTRANEVYRFVSTIDRITSFVGTGGMSEMGSDKVDWKTAVGRKLRGASDKLGITTPGYDYNTGQTAEMGNLLNEQRGLQEAMDRLATVRADYEYKQQIAAETARKNELEDLKTDYAVKTAQADNYYRVLEAQRKSHFARTKQEELEQIRQSAVDEQAHLREKLADANRYWDELASKNVGNAHELRQIEKSKAQDIEKINADLEVAKINAASQAAAKLREIERERRSDLIKSFELSVADVKSMSGDFSKAIKDGIDKGRIGADAGFDALRQDAVDTFNKVLAATKSKNDLSLQDDTLTEQARLNLKHQFASEELRLRADLNEQLRQLDEQRYQKQVEDLKRNFSEMQEVSKSQADIFGSLGSFFDPSRAAGQLNLGALQANNNSDASQVLLLKKKMLQQQYNAGLDVIGAHGGVGSYSKGEKDPAVAHFLELGAAIKSVNTELMQSGYIEFPESLLKLEQLGRDMASGKVGVEGFDLAAKMLLKVKHDFESADLEGQIKLTSRLIDIARGNGDTAGLATLEHQLTSLSNQRTTMGIRQQAEAIEQYENSWEGLQDRLEKLKSGDVATVLGVMDNARKGVAKEQISLAEQNIELEYRLAHVGEDSALRYKNAWLTAIYDIQKASEDAKVEEIKDQVQIADQTVFHADRARELVLRGMAQAKGVTDIFADGFLQVSGLISDSIGGLLDKATDGLGKFGHVLSNIATQLLTMVTNRLMMRVLDMILPPTSGTGAGVAVSAGSSAASGIGAALGSLGGLLRGGSGSQIVGVNGTVVGTLGAGGLAGILKALNSPSGFEGIFGGQQGSSILNSDLLSSTIGQGSGRSAGWGEWAANSGLSSAMGMSKFSWGSLGKSLGAMAPMLGMSIGAGLGGTSTAGNILGMIGGGLGGLALGIGTGAIGTTGALGGLVGALGGTLAATGILAAVAAPFIVGAILLGKKKQRDADEKTRTTYLTDASSQLDQILKDVQAHKYSSGSDAVLAMNKVIEQYTQQANTLKDSKTRRIALNELNPPNKLWSKMDQIKKASGMLDEARDRFNSYGLPEFATGGIVPGALGSPRLVLAHGGEIIANLNQQTPDLLNAAAGAGVPGVRGSAGGGGVGGGPLVVELHVGTQAQNEMFVNGAKSQAGFKVLNKQRGKTSTFREGASSF